MIFLEDPHEYIALLRYPRSLKTSFGVESRNEMEKICSLNLLSFL